MSKLKTVSGCGYHQATRKTTRKTTRLPPKNPVVDYVFQA